LYLTGILEIVVRAMVHMERIIVTINVKFRFPLITDDLDI